MRKACSVVSLGGIRRHWNRVVKEPICAESIHWPSEPKLLVSSSDNDLSGALLLEVHSTELSCWVLTEHPEFQPSTPLCLLRASIWAEDFEHRGQFEGSVSSVESW